MWIKRIEIKNFQKHKKLEVNFTESINVLTGLTDTGKSSIYRALEFVCGMSNISIKDLTKEGESETSVKIWISNGFQIERVRSNTINRYILSKEGCDDKVFDSIGKVVPEEICLALEMSLIEIDNIALNLNFSSQDNLNFLLDRRIYPASFSAKLFNKLTGNELLDSLFKECNRDNLKFNKELKQTEEKLVNQEEELVDYSQQYKESRKKCNLIKIEFEDIKEKVKIYEELKELADKIKTNKENKEFVQFKISKIKIVNDKKFEDLKNRVKEFKELQDMFYSLKSVEESLQGVEKQIKGIKIVKVDFKKLEERCKQLQQYNELYESIQQIEKKQTTINTQINETQEKIRVGEVEFKEVWNKNPICPLCLQKRKKIV